MCRIKVASRVRPLFLAVLGTVLTAGCGDEKPPVSAPQQPFRQAAAPRPSDPVSPDTEEASPPAPTDPLLAAQGDEPPDTVSAGDKRDPSAMTDSTPADPLSVGDDALASGPKMPTEHSHWLSVSQFGERVTVRLNGVWYGDFSGPVLRDITMALRPGPNTLAVTYLPRNAESWLAVHVTEGEHTPPVPDLVSFQVAPHQDLSGEDEAARLSQTTRTFRFMAQ